MNKPGKQFFLLILILAYFLNNVLCDQVQQDSQQKPNGNPETPHVHRKSCKNIIYPLNTTDKAKNSTLDQDEMDVELKSTKSCVGIFASEDCAGDHIHFERSILDSNGKFKWNFSKGNKLANLVIHPKSIQPVKCRKREITQGTADQGQAEDTEKEKLNLEFQINYAHNATKKLSPEESCDPLAMLIDPLKENQNVQNVSLRVANVGEEVVQEVCLELFSSDKCGGKSAMVILKNLEVGDEFTRRIWVWSLNHHPKKESDGAKTQTPQKQTNNDAFIARSLKRCPAMKIHEDPDQDHIGQHVEEEVNYKFCRKEGCNNKIHTDDNKNNKTTAGIKKGKGNTGSALIPYGSFLFPIVLMLVNTII